MFDKIFLISILVILVFLIALYFILLIKHKMKLSKANRYYLIPSSIIVFSLYIYAYIKSGNFVFLNVLESINLTLKIFVLDVKTALVQPIIESDKLYFVCLLLAIIIAAYSMYSSIILFIIDRIKNSIRIKAEFNQDYNDILLVNNYSNYDKVVHYLNNNQNTIVWINDKLNKNDLDSISSKNIKYLNIEFNIKNMEKILKKASKLNVIVLDSFDLDNLLNIISSFKDNNLFDSKKLSFFIEVDNKLLEHLKDNYINLNNLSAYVKVFSKYEMIARNLNYQYPLSSLLNKDAIDEYFAVKKDIDINNFIFGFGKMGEELFKMNVSNNQFCYRDNNKYHAKQVNYYIYDQNNTAISSDYLERCETYKKFYSDEYFEILEDVCNLNVNNKYICEKLLSDDFLKYIKKDSNNFIYLCLDNDDLNIKLASRIKLYLNSLNIDFNYKIFLRVENDKNVLLNNDLDFIYFGNELDILDHDVIVNDKLSSLAIKLNEHYNRNKKDYTINDWYKLSYIKQYSNIYASLNAGFKLGLMGLKIGDKEMERDEYFDIYSDGLKEFKYDDYNAYFKISKRNTFGYLEHLRWNAFYILNGYLPMKKKECVNNNGQLISKDELLKKHSCLTSVYGLDDVHKYYAKVMNKDLKDVETYIYDFMQSDNMYDDLASIGFKISKIDE